MIILFSPQPSLRDLKNEGRSNPEMDCRVATAPRNDNIGNHHNPFTKIAVPPILAALDHGVAGCTHLKNGEQNK